MLIIVAVMIVLFPLKSAIVAALTIPLSTFVSTGIMYALGIELNIITLACLIVVLGMIVDNSIVVIDGYLEYLGKGMGRREAAVKSVQQYFWPMLLATVCICAIFFPILKFMKGEAADVIKLFPLTITINLMVSLVVAAFIIPLLNAAIIRRVKAKEPGKRDITDWVQHWYDKTLEWNFRHPWLTIVGSIVLVVATGALFPLLKMRQFPYADRNQFAVEVYLPEGSGLEETRLIADELSAILKSNDKVTGVTSFVGCSSPRFHTSYAPVIAGKNFAQLIVNTESNEASLELLDQLAPKYSNHWPNAYVRWKQMDYLPVPTYEYRFYGNNTDSIQKAAQMLMEEMRRIPELECAHGFRHAFAHGAGEPRPRGFGTDGHHTYFCRIATDAPDGQGAGGQHLGGWQCGRKEPYLRGAHRNEGPPAGCHAAERCGEHLPDHPHRLVRGTAPGG
jgi:multidrug efflux pump subunit AcrB